MTSPMARSALAALALYSNTALGASGEEWRGKAIYQVLIDRFARTDGSTNAPCDAGQGLYCGGTFQGLASKLDYIQGMGFDAVWISPVTEQLEGQTAYGDPYHGYWQQDINSINKQFGGEEGLDALSRELDSRGMLLMVDIVTNHFAYNGAPENVDYSLFHPFNTSEDFHTYCPIDFNGIGDATQLTHCWSSDTTVSLPDVKTEDQGIRDTWNSWVSNLVDTYGIDGIRLDSAISVEPEFFPGFVSASGVYLVGETFNGDVDFVCNYQNYMPGVMDYPSYFPVFQAFTSSPKRSLSDLASLINQVKDSCKDTTIKGTFTENHDIPRTARLNGDITAAKNLITYTLLADGIPIIYQGQEQHYASLGGDGDPYNREALWLSGYNTDAELYKLVARLNSVRKVAIADDSSYLTYQNYPIYDDDTTIAMRKGKMVTVLSNKGEGGNAYDQKIDARYDANEELTEVLTCETLTADAKGAITVPMEGGLPRVYYPAGAVSAVCGGSEKREEHVRRHVGREYQA